MASSGLRDLAAARALWVGACVAARPLADDPQYAETLRRECNLLTPENDMKLGPIHPTRERYDFSRADAIVQFAAAHGKAVHGHTLAWHNQNPEWLAGSHANLVRVGALAPAADSRAATMVGHGHSSVKASRKAPPRNNYFVLLSGMPGAMSQSAAFIAGQCLSNAGRRDAAALRSQSGPITMVIQLATRVRASQHGRGGAAPGPGALWSDHVCGRRASWGRRGG